MRLVTFRHHDRTRLGRLHADEVLDLAAAAPELPTDMLALLTAGSDALTVAERADGPRLALADVTLLAPIPRPPKILAIGLNYADHAAESGQEVPPFPKVFNKQSTAVVGPGAPRRRHADAAAGLAHAGRRRPRRDRGSGRARKPGHRRAAPQLKSGPV